MPAPILVVEIVSASTLRRDLVAKRSLYTDAGVPEYWFVDGDTRSIRIVRRDGERLSTDTLEWRPAPSDTPFVLDIAALFRDAVG